MAEECGAGEWPRPPGLLMRPAERSRLVQFSNHAAGGSNSSSSSGTGLLMYGLYVGRRDGAENSVIAVEEQGASLPDDVAGLVERESMSSASNPVTTCVAQERLQRLGNDSRCGAKCHRPG